MYYYAYMLWKYSQYTYSALCYANALRHYVFDKKQKKQENDEWVLVEPKEPSVILYLLD